ncbi:MAG: NUDIX hydrolase [Patescibacteria group bacterium]
MADLSKHFHGAVAQKILLEREGKVLIVRNHGEDIWDLPGGHLDYGEKPLAGIAREVTEETGLTLSGIAPFLVSDFVSVRNGQTLVLIVYAAKAAEGEVVPQVDELAEVRWVGPGDISSLQFFPEYKEALEKFFKVG